MRRPSWSALTTCPGVLTLPDGEGPFPAAVLVHGSGPNDRNETNGNTAIFRDLAQALSRQGIAVLRYDKRTYQVNQGALSLTQAEIDNMTVYEETMEDAVAAVRLLREDARIDARARLHRRPQPGRHAGRTD